MWETLTKLGKSVGGTAIGYAVVAPTHKYSPSGSVIVLPGNASIQSTAKEDSFQII